MPTSEGNLTFEHLDDIALAAIRRGIDPTVHLRSLRIARIGPLIELLALDRCGMLPFEATPKCRIREALTYSLRERAVSSGCHAIVGPSHVGFILTNRDPEAADQACWLTFCRRAQQAAELSLPKPIARGLVGAMRELEENIHLHSERAFDGVVGYRGTPDEFEFSIADSGIGLLNSLRQSPEFEDLNDTGAAIQIALTDGRSRLGWKVAGRGYGFHALFVGLANLNGHLRFRSGDHALCIDGTSPSLIAAHLSQKTDVAGFSANIVCGPSPVGPAPS